MRRATPAVGPYLSGLISALIFAAVCCPASAPGVRPGSGGENHPPELVPLADAPLRAGATQSLIISAADRDGDPLTYRIVAGPPFVSVRTLNPGQPEAYGEIQIAPDSCSPGTFQCVIEVSDGTGADLDTLQVTVHPLAVPVPVSPMQPPKVGARSASPCPSPVPDTLWIAGEWEWRGESFPASGCNAFEKIAPRVSGMEPLDGPMRRGYRRRLVIRRDGSVDMFEIAPGRPIRVERGTFSLARAFGSGRWTTTELSGRRNQGASPSGHQPSWATSTGTCSRMWPSWGEAELTRSWSPSCRTAEIHMRWRSLGEGSGRGKGPTSHGVIRKAFGRSIWKRCRGVPPTHSVGGVASTLRPTRSRSSRSVWRDSITLSQRAGPSSARLFRRKHDGSASLQLTT